MKRWTRPLEGEIEFFKAVALFLERPDRGKPGSRPERPVQHRQELHRCTK